LAINENYLIVATHSNGVFRFELSNILTILNGDINGDDLINVIDVIATVNLVLNGEFNSLADLNNDGQINVLDILLIVNIILNN